jgi:hypothetical protein
MALNTQNKKATAYQQLAEIVNDIKQEKISVKQAMNKLQIKDGPQRPYAKVSRSGAVALFGITKDPIVMYESQWNRLQKTIESGYLRKYMEHNKDRISHGRVRKSDNEGDITKVVEESIAVEEVTE